RDWAGGGRTRRRGRALWGGGARARYQWAGRPLMAGGPPGRGETGGGRGGRDRREPAKLESGNAGAQTVGAGHAGTRRGGDPRARGDAPPLRGERLLQREGQLVVEHVPGVAPDHVAVDGAAEGVEDTSALEGFRSA